MINCSRFVKAGAAKAHTRRPQVERHAGMAKTLQELRKDAGYKSAREFAEAMAIPQSTYARYEQSPENIPVKVAWELADALKCTIDMVVGRDAPDVSAMRGDVQRFHDSLSEPNKQLHSDFMAFLATREADTRKRNREIEAMRNETSLKLLETAFAAHLLDSGETVDSAFFTADEMRSRFKAFLQKCVDDGKIPATRKDGKEAVSGYMADYDSKHSAEAGSAHYAMITL